jgi:heme exporter protein CcmD
MKYAQYVLPAYAMVFGAMAVFALGLMARGRRLGRGVADEDKPWT